MSFQDEATEPVRPTHLVYRCRRCSETNAEAHPDAEVALRRAVEAGLLATVHACRDGASGLAELVGTGPGRPFTNSTEAT